MVQKTGIIVQKKNYTLRTWQTEDVASLAQYLNNKNIWDNCRDGLPYPYSQEDANVFLSMVQAKENIQDFCIEVNGEAVGSIGFVPATDVERFSTEVGYWIGEPFWNQGIVTDALKEAINYYFEHTDKVRVFAVVFEHNSPSMRVLEKVGFKKTGIFRKACYKNGRICQLSLHRSRTSCPFQDSLPGARVQRGAGRLWRPQKATGLLKHRPSRQARPQPFEGSQGGTPCPVI